MKMPQLATLSFFFLATVLLQQSTVFGQPDFYLWRNGNPGINENLWTHALNWQHESPPLVVSTSAPTYGTDFGSDTGLIFAGGSLATQRAIYSAGVLVTTFGSDLRIGANQVLSGGGAFNQAGYLDVASGTLIIGGNAFISGGNTVGNPSRLDISGGQLLINGTSLNLNSGAATTSELNLDSGILQVNQFTKSGAGAVVVNFGNGTLRAGATNANFFSVLAGTTVNLTGNTSIDTAGQGIAIAQVLNGAGGFTKIGSGTLTLSGSNLYTGKTAVHNGTVAISSEANLGATPGAAVADQLTLGTGGTQGTLQANATFGISTNRGVTLSGAGGMIDVANGQTLTVNSVIAGNGSLQKSGAAGTLVLTNNNTYAGGTTVSAGTLRLSGSGSVLGNVSVGNTATFEIARSLTFTGNVTGAGTLLVSQGTTLMNGNSTAATTVSNGATLGGNGTVGNLVVNGTLAPGTSIESLGAGNVTFNNGSIFNYEINTAALNGDLLNGTGSLSINGTVTLNFLPEATGAVALDSKLTLISYNGTWNGGVFNGFGNNSIFSTASNTWQINYNDNAPGSNVFGGDLAATGFVTITAVPEPSSIFLVGIAACFALVRRRRTAV